MQAKVETKPAKKEEIPQQMTPEIPEVGKKPTQQMTPEIPDKPPEERKPKHG